MVIQDLLFVGITLAAFGVLVALVKGTERLRHGAGDE